MKHPELPLVIHGYLTVPLASHVCDIPEHTIRWWLRLGRIERADYEGDVVLVKWEDVEREAQKTRRRATGKTRRRRTGK